ncbi:hypothetical protein DFR79_104119 [Halanaerobium saccharolyticum]|uniref:Uncharacterized protein n=1 Tax=Halanaerobium saccharolyticum TaxID=43595 RepID=A0A4R6LZ99_9FIRM|nr:hypothetical protein [Halanaerobium saccharolyticum]TDO94153.1 hypothetical protein DFR79_104119 [Halanaerobium saccharolyticum]
MPATIAAYHGTDSNNVDDIKDKNFIYKHDKSHWLGNGIYFFMDGIGEDPITLASKWAIAQSWNNNAKHYSYKNYSVLKTEVNLENISILDLTSDDGLELYNRYRNRLLNKLSYYDLRENYSGNSGFEYDFKLFEHIKNNSSVGIIISHIYIKFTKERKALVKSRIPNCTIISIDDNNYLDKGSIAEVKKGRVDNG